MSDRVKDLKQLSILNEMEFQNDDVMHQICEQFGRWIDSNQPQAMKQCAVLIYER